MPDPDRFRAPVARSIVDGIAWPALPSTAASAVLALAEQLDRSQWWPSEALRAAQLEQAGELLRHAADTVPYYAGTLSAAGIDPRVPLDEERWRRIPILERRELQAAGDALLSRAVPAGHGATDRIATSGATGTPVEVVRTALGRLLGQALTVREQTWRGRDLDAHAASVRVTRRAPEHLASWGLLHELFHGRGTAAHLDIHTPIEQQVEWLAREDPHYLLTYPSNLAALLRHAEVNGTELELVRLREVRTVSEIVEPNLRTQCRERLGVPLVDEYSAQETGSLAIQCPHAEHYHVQAESTLLEVLDDDGMPCRPGDIGRVVVTPLHDFAMPLVRYAIGDYAISGSPCRCGRGLPVLERVVGRQRNMIRLPGGGRQWPLPDDGRFRRIAPILQYQFVQLTPYRLRARLVAERVLTARERKRFADAVVQFMGHPFRVEVEQVERIERSVGGKFEDFICVVDDDAVNDSPLDDGPPI